MGAAPVTTYKAADGTKYLVFDVARCEWHGNGTEQIDASRATLTVVAIAQLALYMGSLHQ
jgi:hypothetical protein